jgi:hypothetical protein
MSADWVNDINRMQTKFGVRNWISQASPFQLKKYLEFRLKFIKEEYDETREALIEEDAEEIVDGLIDICVVAIGTLDAMGINAHTAWDEIFVANMTKEVGIKEERPNPLGLPDLIKPPGWVNPSHAGNHGLIPNAWSEEITKKAMEANKARAEILQDNPEINTNWNPGAMQQMDDKIDFTKDSEYVRMYGTKVEKI